MRFFAVVVVGVAIHSAGIAGAAASPVDEQNSAWITQFKRYSAQKQIEPEYEFASTRPGANSITLSGVLRALPSPEHWPELQSALTAASQIPDAQTVEKQRLQAGAWLLAYLSGDRAGLETKLTAAITATGPEESSPSSYALRQVKDSLADRNESAMSPEKQLQMFEAQLVMLEPIDEAAVKRAMGGEEHFAQLKQLIQAGREMRNRFAEIYAEYEKTKDEAAARAKAEILEKEFADKNGAAMQAIAQYQNEPLVARYANSLALGDAAETPIPGMRSLQVPDLVAFAGRERAADLLRRAFRASASLSIEREIGEPTRQLARQVAMEEINTVKVPSWGLVQDVQSADLFEAYLKKFPPADKKDYQFRNACGYYLTSLIREGRSAEAVTFITEQHASGDEDANIRLPYEVMSKLEQTHADELWKFLHAWLTVNPGAGEWDRFNRLSVQLDRRDELKAMIKALAENGGFDGIDRLTVQQMQADAELATGEIVAAVRRLRALVETPAASEKERTAQRLIAWRLLKLADLQADPSAFASALAAGEAVLAKDKEAKIQDAISGANDLAATLGELGHFADSARLARSALDAIRELMAAAAVTKKEADDFRHDAPDHLAKDLLAQQLRAAVELGHWDEAGSLLQENPGWGAADIAGLLDRRLSDKGKPVGYYVARVAQAKGDLVLTRRILEAQLTVTPSADSIYESYLAVAHDDALPLLEKLATADHYEERPLIWKARLQLDAKQWDAAIATLQQAISIDPSDGEEGRGDRMRVYAFMSTAMAGKGDPEKAGFFANVVKAIRISETADRWYEIGAYAHAIDLYREALGFFQDAYCIQSRLAIRLADAGKMDEAAEHYRRAFELMPDSFGRVESHCFGCEHVFQGKKSQGVAEEVFARLLKARPDKPQLHYLSGYLREEQEHLSEAAEYYRRAVELDPLYLNAWDRLTGLDDRLKFTPAQRDDLLLKLVELDPAGRHASPNFEKVTDLRRLWRALNQAGKVLDDLPAAAVLGELKASAARLAQTKEESAPLWETGRTRKDFAKVVLDRRFVQALQRFLGSLNTPHEEESTQPGPAAKTL